jgi:SAM-dependent methyltransferase
MSLGIAVGQPEDYGMSAEEYWRIRNIFDVQSMSFATEVLPVLYGLYGAGDHELTLLDVGARTGAGTGLIGYLHQPYAYSRFKIHATALDLDGRYVGYARAHFPNIEYLHADITAPDFDRTFDIVLASHTLEHVGDPDGFLAALQRLAKQHVIIACPFEEENLIAGHVNRFTHDFFSRHAVTTLKVYDSVAWVGSKACIAVLPGTARERPALEPAEALAAVDAPPPPPPAGEMMAMAAAAPAATATATTSDRSLFRSFAHHPSVRRIR